MFICIDTLQCAGVGTTLDTAYQNYNQNHGIDPIEECTFYENAEPLKVEVKIIPAKTISKSYA